MGKSIKENLIKLFSQYRIVFWNDNKNEMFDEFQATKIKGVENLQIKNNEFSIKYKLLKENPNQKFLIYITDYENKKQENWLLDIQLYSGIFSADKIKIWMNELELEPYFEDTVIKHRIFFNSEKRKKILKENIKKEDNIKGFKKKLLLTITESDEDIEGLISKLFEESFLQKDGYLKLIKKCNLEEFMWDLIEEEYAYKNLNPSISDFALELFKSCFQFSVNDLGTLNKNNSILLFQRWKNNSKNNQIFEGLSCEFEKVLNISENINKLNYKELLDLDFFKEIDCFIIKSLINEIKEKTISNIEVNKIFQERRKTYWFKEFKNIYNAVLFSSEFLFSTSYLLLELDNFDKYIEVYSNKLFKIDQLYRKFIFYYQKSSQPSLLGDIYNLIENKYANDFLLNINNNFQKTLDKLTHWETQNINSQRSFYKQFIKERSKNHKKSIVIISDALRFEIGDELNKKISHLDNLTSKLIPLIASLPSYTQIGMASLLPVGELSIPLPSKPNVTHNSDPSGGIINRTKILNKEISSDNPYVSKVPDFLNLNSNEYREIIKDHNVIYLYHDRIDAIGDSKKTEGNVFEAVEDSIEELIKLVQKIGKFGSTNIFITADHGFIYQNREIEESDYLSVRPEGEEIFHIDRRFILGKNLKNSKSFKKFTSQELNIKGDFEVLFPKSINRLRKSGSGSRFVHGGISLQEIIVPVVKIIKSKTKDTNLVGVTILTGASNNITTSQISVTLYQESPIDSKNISRKLLIGLFTEDKKLISNQIGVEFDSDSDNAREREQTIQLILTKSADHYNHQEVSLNLDEKYKNTSHMQTYKSTKFIIKRTFTNDFDF